jgi:hypothetical protein
MPLQEATLPQDPSLPHVRQAHVSVEHLRREERADLLPLTDPTADG